MLGTTVLYFLLPLIPLVLTGVRTSGRLVATPSLEACKNRPKHYMDKRTGHYYFFSGKSKFGALKVSCRQTTTGVIVRIAVVGVEYHPPAEYD